MELTVVQCCYLLFPWLCAWAWKRGVHLTLSLSLSLFSSLSLNLGIFCYCLYWLTASKTVAYRADIKAGRWTKILGCTLWRNPGASAITMSVRVYVCLFMLLCLWSSSAASIQQSARVQYTFYSSAAEAVRFHYSQQCGEYIRLHVAAVSMNGDM